MSQKIKEEMMGVPSIVFTRKAVVDKTFLPRLTDLCKSFVGKDASQMYPYLRCQPMPVRLQRVGILIRKPAGFYQDVTRAVTLKIAIP